MRIFVLDQWPLITVMIKMIIHQVRPDAKISAVQTFSQLCELISRDAAPDVIVIDPLSKGCSGKASVALIAKLLPNALIIVTTENKAGRKGSSTLQTGAHHVIYKKETVKILRKTFLDIFACRFLNDSEYPNATVLKVSKRQQQLLELLNQGFTNARIAHQLGISEDTVKVHFLRLYKLFGVHSRLQALKFAKQQGWLIDFSYP